MPGTTLEGGYFKAYSRPGSRSPAGFQMRRGRHWQPTQSRIVTEAAAAAAADRAARQGDHGPLAHTEWSLKAAAAGGPGHVTVTRTVTR